LDAYEDFIKAAARRRPDEQALLLAGGLTGAGLGQLAGTAVMNGHEVSLMKRMAGHTSNVLEHGFHKMPRLLAAESKLFEYGSKNLPVLGVAAGALAGVGAVDRLLHRKKPQRGF
jgi:hypothetical protein